RGVTEEDRYTAAVILIDGMLGEERRLDEIDEVEVVLFLEPELGTKVSSIQDLPQHLAHLAEVGRRTH
ncbi:MAG: hypothetical protein KC431_15150, partial [Myxococcales bacterium]|nr:hypothetical protein [Myxococcales bacterium]